MEAVFIVVSVLAAGLAAWEWRAFWLLDPRATLTALPVYRQELDAAAMALLRSGNPFGYKTRATGDAELLVRPVSRFESGPSAAPFLFALAKVTDASGRAALTAYLPSGPLAIGALVVLASVTDGVGGAIWALLILCVGGFGFLMELNEAKLCFKRLERLAHDGSPAPLMVSKQPDNNEMQA